MTESPGKRKLEAHDDLGAGTQIKKAKIAESLAELRVSPATSSCQYASMRFSMQACGERSFGPDLARALQIRNIGHRRKSRVSTSSTAVDHLQRAAVQVHIVVHAIPNGSRRLKSWQTGLEKHGAHVVQVCILQSAIFTDPLSHTPTHDFLANWLTIKTVIAMLRQHWFTSYEAIKQVLRVTAALYS